MGRREMTIGMAIEMKDVGLLTAVLKDGADVNERIEHNGTHLHLAVMYCPLDFLQIMLDRGADINAVDDRGWTPLDNAHREKTVAFLKQHGAKSGEGISSPIIIPAAPPQDSIEVSEDIGEEGVATVVPADFEPQDWTHICVHCNRHYDIQVPMPTVPCPGCGKGLMPREQWEKLGKQ